MKHTSWILALVVGARPRRGRRPHDGRRPPGRPRRRPPVRAAAPAAPARAPPGGPQGGLPGPGRRLAGAGPGRRARDHRRVLRLRVPLLQAGRPDHEADRGGLPRQGALRLQAQPAPLPRQGAARPPSPPRRGAPRAAPPSSGRCTTGSSTRPRRSTARPSRPAAQAAGLDMTAFRKALDEKRHEARIRRDQALVNGAGRERHPDLLRERPEDPGRGALRDLQGASSTRSSPRPRRWSSRASRPKDVYARIMESGGHRAGDAPGRPPGSRRPRRAAPAAAAGPGRRRSSSAPTTRRRARRTPR